MSVSTTLREYIAACFTGLWVQSHEHEDALTEIAQLCRDEDWRLAIWDIAQGLQIPGQSAEAESTGSDALAAIRYINSLATPDGTAILVLTNFHRFMNSAEVVQALARQIVQGKQNRTFVVILSPVVDIPKELEKQIVVVEHDLPNREQLEEIARGVAVEEGELPDGDELATVLDAAAGLTRYEAEGAFSLSLVRDGQVRPQAIWELKSQMLKKSGLLTLHQGGESFADLGGLDSLKSFCVRAMCNQRHDNPLKRPRGVMLLSPPGCGKSQFAKSLGNETGRPTLALDIGSLMGSLVGQTESNIRQALNIADAMQPCVLFLDECEKALSGAASSGQTVNSGIDVTVTSDGGPFRGSFSDGDARFVGIEGIVFNDEIEVGESANFIFTQPVQVTQLKLGLLFSGDVARATITKPDDTTEAFTLNSAGTWSGSENATFTDGPGILDYWTVAGGSGQENIFGSNFVKSLSLTPNSGSFNVGTVGFSAIPEPSALALLGIAGVGLIATRRRRKRAV